MGDRCWARLTIKTSDIKKFIKINNDYFKDEFKNTAIDESSDTTEIEFDEINYGGYDMMNEFQSAGRLTCLLEHSRGDNYGPGYDMLFFGYRRGVSLSCDAEFFVILDDEGNVDEDMLKKTRESIKIKKLIESYFEGEIKNYAAALAKLTFTNTDPILCPEIK